MPREKLPRSDIIRLRHMRDAARKALLFVAGQDLEGLDGENQLSLAIIRLLEVVGEAAKSVSRSTRDELPGIPWRSIAGTRDRLIHGYFDVDMDVIRSILRNDLPPLADALDAVLNGPD